MTDASTTMDQTEIAFRTPQVADAEGVYDLICASPPLDRNSRYCYLLLCSHFADTSLVAERDGQLVGFMSAYRKPSDEKTLFVWQVVTHASCRGLGLARSMLLRAAAPQGRCPYRYIEASVTRSNNASFSLFESLARALDTSCTKSLLFSSENFGSSGHEEEYLVRIGPLKEGQPTQKEG